MLVAVLAVLVLTALRQQRRDPEAASAPVLMLELMFVILLFALAAAVLAQHQVPRPGAPNAWIHEELEGRARSVLQADEFATDAEYDTKAKGLVIQALNGDCEPVFKHFRQTLHPQGTFTFGITSSDGRAQELCSDAPEGVSERAGASVPFMFLQDNAYVATEFDAHDGKETAMEVLVVPLRFGYPVQRLLPLEVTATTEGGAAFRAAAAVRVMDEASQATIALVKDGKHINYYEPTAFDEFTLRVNETAGVALQPGTRLALHLPWAWTNVEPIGDNPGWRGITVVHGQDGWTLNATLDTTLANAGVDFQFKAKRPPAGEVGSTSFDLAYATLDDGAKGTAHLVFRGKNTTATQAQAFAKGLSIAAPSQLAPGKASPWSVTFANPNKVPSTYDLNDVCVLVCETLVNITLHQPGGKAVFSNVQGDGWSKVDDATLRWQGSRKLGSDRAAEFRFNVTTANAEYGEYFAPEARVKFPGNDHHENLTSYAAGNAFRVRVAANQSVPGYALQARSDERGSRPHVCSDLVLDGRLHRGCAPYRISNLASLASVSDKLAEGSAASTLTIDNGTEARTLDWLTIRANFTGLDKALQDDPAFVAGRATRITVHYPWTGKEGYVEAWPVWMSREALGPMFNVSIALPVAMVYGTYVVVAERDVDLAGGEAVDQVVRKVAMVTVGPYGGPWGGAEARRMHYDLWVTVWPEGL